MIEVGDVLHLYFTTIHIPAYKYCIVIQLEPRPSCVLINSELTEFAKSRPMVRDTYAPILATECAPLRYDSWIGCADHVGFDLNDAIQSLEKNPNYHYGKTSCAVACRIIETMKNSDTLSDRKRRIATEQLSISFNLQPI